MEVIVKIKVISLLGLIFLGAYASQSNAFFYGAVIMHNAETQKTVVLLPDEHLKSDVDKMQQEEVISLVKELEKRGQTVHVLVEDMASLLRQRYCTLYSLYQLYRLPSSPLSLLCQRCKKNNINSTNVEFRDDKDEIYRYDREKQILSAIDSNILEKLYRNHSNHFLMAQIMQGPVLDANVLNSIKGNDASVTVVCAGAAHTASVAKILYQQGYTKTDVKTCQHLPACDRSWLYDFDKDEPLAKPSSPYFDPTPLLNLKAAVLDSLEESLKKNELKLHKQKTIKRFKAPKFTSFVSLITPAFKWVPKSHSARATNNKHNR